MTLWWPSFLIRTQKAQSIKSNNKLEIIKWICQGNQKTAWKKIWKMHINGHRNTGCFGDTQVSPKPSSAATITIKWGKGDVPVHTHATCTLRYSITSAVMLCLQENNVRPIFEKRYIIKCTRILLILFKCLQANGKPLFKKLEVLEGGWTAMRA